jgi:hypothetical protein
MLSSQYDACNDLPTLQSLAIPLIDRISRLDLHLNPYKGR